MKNILFSLILFSSCKMIKCELLITPLTVDTVAVVPPIEPPLPSAIVNIVADGNSLTEGYNKAGVIGQSYPKQLGLLEPFKSNGSKVFNFGVGGQTITQMLVDASTQIDSKLSSTLRNVCLVWEGRNEMDMNNTSAVDCFTKLKKYCTDRKTAGFEVYLLTNTPSYNYNNFADLNTRINTLNQLIINDNSNTFKVIRVDLIPQFQISSYVVNDYFGDGLHFTDLGYSLIAQKVKEEILK